MRPDPDAEPDRTGPDHDSFKKRRPNRVEPEKETCQTELNRNEAK